ncbi:hypothetical protein [Streptomyces xiamenensis]|nr:hypothetical protein [Streptomyces xiamenensis]
MNGGGEEQRVREAVRRHERSSTFTEAEKVISAVLSDPQVQQVRARSKAAESELGVELSARLQPFQDRYGQALRESDTAVLTGICPGTHGRWDGPASWTTGTRRRCEEPRWGHTSEGRPIAWVDSAPDDR